MLVIDKSKETTRFILTLSETTSDLTGCIIDLYSAFDNTNHIFQLPSDTSIYPERFNEFIFNTNTFSDLRIGTYRYSIKDNADAIISTGLLKVDDIVQSAEEDLNDEYIIYQSEDSTDDDYIVYE